MSNELTLLNIVLDEYFDEGSFVNKDKAFEVFSTEQIFKDHNLGIDEILNGLVGEKQDGGIDGFYIFVNDELINDIEDFEIANRMYLDLYILQYKNKDAIEESVINMFIVASDLLFQLDVSPDELTLAFSQSLSEKIQLFHSTIKKVASKNPVVSIKFFHVTKGDRRNIFGERFANNSYINKIDRLGAKVIETNLGGIEYNYEIVDASSLLELSRKTPSYSLELKLNENPIAIEYKEGNQRGYIASVNIVDYYNFLKNPEDGSLRKYLFESNIRDYQNKTTVNIEIGNTINSGVDYDFWWLNNGITIIAEKGNLVGKTLNLENIQIVNGLQTSHTIFNTLSNRIIENEKRSVLLKIVITEKKETMDAIIKSTNSQNTVPPAFLRATHPVQRQIEEYLLSKGFYYDRRKNYYKNQKKPTKKIISINYLSQCLAAILERNPSKARSNPTILTKKESDYKRLYPEGRKMEVYLKCIEIMKIVEQYLKEKFQPSDITEEHISSYYTFHIGRILASFSIGKSKYNDKFLLELRLDDITDDTLHRSITILKEIILSYQKQHAQNNLTYISKQIPFSDYITNELVKKYL